MVACLVAQEKKEKTRKGLHLNSMFRFANKIKEKILDIEHHHSSHHATQDVKPARGCPIR